MEPETLATKDPPGARAGTRTGTRSRTTTGTTTGPSKGYYSPSGGGNHSTDIGGNGRRSRKDDGDAGSGSDDLLLQAKRNIAYPAVRGTRSNAARARKGPVPVTGVAKGNDSDVVRDAKTLIAYPVYASIDNEKEQTSDDTTILEEGVALRDDRTLIAYPVPASMDKQKGRTSDSNTILEEVVAFASDFNNDSLDPATNWNRKLQSSGGATTKTDGTSWADQKAKRTSPAGITKRGAVAIVEASACASAKATTTTTTMKVEKVWADKEAKWLSPPDITKRGAVAIVVASASASASAANITTAAGKSWPDTEAKRPSPPDITRRGAVTTVNAEHTSATDFVPSALGLETPDSDASILTDDAVEASTFDMDDEDEVGRGWCCCRGRRVGQ